MPVLPIVDWQSFPPLLNYPPMAKLLRNKLTGNHIRKLPNGKYRLYSHKGKNLGTFGSQAAAAKHEGEVEYFKHSANEAAQHANNYNPNHDEQGLFAKTSSALGRGLVGVGIGAGSAFLGEGVGEAIGSVAGGAIGGLALGPIGVGPGAFAGRIAGGIGGYVLGSGAGQKAAESIGGTAAVRGATIGSFGYSGIKTAQLAKGGLDSARRGVETVSSSLKGRGPAAALVGARKGAKSAGKLIRAKAGRGANRVKAAYRKVTGNEEVYNFNPNHDAHGLFSSEGGSGEELTRTPKGAKERRAIAQGHHEKSLRLAAQAVKRHRVAQLQEGAASRIRAIETVKGVGAGAAIGAVAGGAVGALASIPLRARAAYPARIGAQIGAALGAGIGGIYKYATNQQLETVTCNITGKVREAMLNGRRFLIAPLRMLRVGVLNGSQGPLYYPPEECAKDPMAWNHMPIVVNHPRGQGGRPISARHPAVLNKYGIGYVFNTNFLQNRNLDAEGWFDIEKCRQVEPRILNNIRKGQSIELSTGLFTDNQPVRNAQTFNGKPYDFIARNYRPDHLAILPDNKGACSTSDGCGVLVNELSSNADSGERWVTIGGKHVKVDAKGNPVGGSSLPKKVGPDNGNKVSGLIGDTVKGLGHAAGAVAAGIGTGVSSAVSGVVGGLHGAYVGGSKAGAQHKGLLDTLKQIKQDSLAGAGHGGEAGAKFGMRASVGSGLIPQPAEHATIGGLAKWMRSSTTGSPNESAGRGSIADSDYEMRMGWNEGLSTNTIIPTGDGRYRVTNKRGIQVGIYPTLLEASQQEDLAKYLDQLGDRQRLLRNAGNPHHDEHGRFSSDDSDSGMQKKYGGSGDPEPYDETNPEHQGIKDKMEQDQTDKNYDDYRKHRKAVKKELGDDYLDTAEHKDEVPDDWHTFSKEDKVAYIKGGHEFKAPKQSMFSDRFNKIVAGAFGGGAMGGLVGGLPGAVGGVITGGAIGAVANGLNKSIGRFGQFVILNSRRANNG